MAIAAGAFEPFYLRIFTIDRVPFGSMLAGVPYRQMPGMRQFLLEVRARTRDGDAVAIAAPFPHTIVYESGNGHIVTATRKGGYDYIYNRACYLLAGRRVLPLPDPGDHPLPGDLQKANFLAAFLCDPAVPGFVVIWRGRDGELLRRMP